MAICSVVFIGLAQSLEKPPRVAEAVLVISLVGALPIGIEVGAVVGRSGISRRIAKRS